MRSREGGIRRKRAGVGAFPPGRRSFPPALSRVSIALASLWGALGFLCAPAFEASMASGGSGSGAAPGMPPGTPSGAGPAAHRPARAAIAAGPGAPAPETSSLSAGTDPSVLWGYLGNGLGYAVIESHAAPIVGSVAVIRGGSGAEDWSSQGASHFLEHLLFNGTRTRSQEQITDEMDLLGAYNNATTRGTHVAYMVVAPKADFWKAFDVQQDMIFHSTLPADKLEKERGIILEELGHSKDDQGYEIERVLDLDLFAPQGYGLPTIGSETSIRTINREQILSFYNRFYTPSRIIWLLIGDLDAQAAAESLEARVGGIPSVATETAPGRQFDLSAPLVRVHRLPVKGAVVAWSWIGPDPTGPDFNAYRARLEVMSEGDESPLGRICLARWSGAVEEYSAALREYPGFSVFSVRLNVGDAARVRLIVDGFPAALAEAQAARPAAEQVAAWKVRAETDEQYLREKPHYYGIMRGDLIAARGLAGLAGYLPGVLAVRPEEVTAIAAPLPWPPARVSVVVPSEEVGPDSSAAAAASYQEWDLPNGAHVAALSSPESPVLAVHLFIRDRSAREPSGRAGIAELMQNLLGKATAVRSSEKLGLALNQIGAELKTADDPDIPYDDFYTTPEYSFVRFQTLDRFATEGFGLLAEMLGQPAFPEPDFEQAKAAALRRAARAETSSRAAASRLFATWLRPGGSAGDVYGTPASLSPITLDEVRSFAKGYLDPRSFLFVVASHLPPDQLRALTESTLGRIPAPSGISPVAPLRGESAASGIGCGDAVSRIRGLLADRSQPQEWSRFGMGVVAASKETSDSLALLADSVGSPQAYLGLVRVFEAPDSLKPVLEVANGILSDRMAQQLREREGLAYTIGSSLREEAPGTWLWTASAGTSPQKLERVLSGFRGSPRELLQAPPDSLEVAKTAARIYGRGLMRRATRINWAYYAGLAILDGEDPRGLEQRERELSHVRPGQVAEVVKRYWESNPGVVVLAR